MRSSFTLSCSTGVGRGSEGALWTKWKSVKGFVRTSRYTKRVETLLTVRKKGKPFNPLASGSLGTAPVRAVPSPSRPSFGPVRGGEGRGEGGAAPEAPHRNNPVVVRPK